MVGNGACGPSRLLTMTSTIGAGSVCNVAEILQLPPGPDREGELPRVAGSETPHVPGRCAFCFHASVLGVPLRLLVFQVLLSQGWGRPRGWPARAPAGGPAALCAGLGGYARGPARRLRLLPVRIVVIRCGGVSNGRRSLGWHGCDRRAPGGMLRRGSSWGGA